MFNLIDKWLSKLPTEEHAENEILASTPRSGISRRGFVHGLVGGLLGVSTGIIQPSRNILISTNSGPVFYNPPMLDYPREFSILGFTYVEIPVGQILAGAEPKWLITISSDDSKIAQAREIIEKMDAIPNTRTAQ